MGVDQWAGPSLGLKPSVGSRATARLRPRGRAAAASRPMRVAPAPAAHADRDTPIASRSIAGTRAGIGGAPEVAVAGNGDRFGIRLHADRAPGCDCHPCANCASAIRAMLAACSDRRGHARRMILRGCGRRRLGGNPPDGASSTALRPCGCLRLRPPRPRACRRGNRPPPAAKEQSHGYHRIRYEARGRSLRR
jgi:hypothetical protein